MLNLLFESLVITVRVVFLRGEAVDLLLKYVYSICLINELKQYELRVH